MDDSFPLLGTMFVLFVGSIAVLYFRLGRGYRRGGPNPPAPPAPAKLSFTPVDATRWRDKPGVDALAIPLLRRGFTDAGAYSVREIPGSTVRFLVHEGDSMIAVAYENARGQHWLDVMTPYVDGTDWLYSTQPGDSQVHRPGCTRYYAPRLTPEQLFGKMKIERDPKDSPVLTVENAPKVFSAAYALHRKFIKDSGRHRAEVEEEEEKE
jgi:hypothetical protein